MKAQPDCIRSLEMAYRLSCPEEEAVCEGLEQAPGGELVSDEEIATSESAVPRACVART